VKNGLIFLTLYQRKNTGAESLHRRYTLQVIIISVTNQLLYHRRRTGVFYTYPISTAANGVGNIRDSLRTPTGLHRIHTKIGDGMPLFTTFVGRIPVGIYNPLCDNPSSDWILTRILWLEGMQTGKNRRGRMDTKSRFIYIHGTHDEDNIGTPVSHGCIRMRNIDMLELFEHARTGESVRIIA